MPRSWITDAILVGGALLGALLLSALHWSAALLPLAALVAWHLRNLILLLRTLTNHRHDVPESFGLWGDAFELLYRDRQQVQRRLHKLRRRMRRFEESSAALPYGAVALNAKGEIEWLNEAALQLLGLDAQRDEGQRITNVVRSPAFTTYFEGGDRHAGIEFPSPLDDRQILFAQLVTYRRNLSLLVVRDVSEVKRLSEMRRDFIANASHELRTPLTVIKGFLDSMELAREQFADTWHRPIESMRQQADRMLRIITDMLSLARLESRPPGVAPTGAVDMVSLLQEACDAADTLGGAQGQVTARLDALWLRGDEPELRSIAMNLVQNAVLHNPPGTRVEVLWRATDDGGALLEVRDAGPGIAPEHLDRLTERFYRVDENRSRDAGGTGLGLAIVKHALSHYGTALQVDSELGGGSRFSCRFPSRSVIEPLRRIA